MKYFLIFLFLLNALIVFAQSQVQSDINTMTDPRDGEVYQIKTFTGPIGYGVQVSQTWMVENLRFEIYDGSYLHEALIKRENEARIFGRLYSREAAREACPRSWHLPSDIEWQRFIHIYAPGLTAADSKKVYSNLIAGGASGFDAQLGGSMTRTKAEQFTGFLEFGSYWSAAEQNSNQAWIYVLSKNGASMTRSSAPFGEAYFSCRCIKD